MWRRQRPLAQKHFRHMELEHNTPWSPGEVCHVANIAAVDTLRRKPADWTVDQRLCRGHLQRELGGGVVHVPGVEVQLGCCGKQASEKCHVYPASRGEKPPYFNQYTPWMAMEPSSPKVAKSRNWITFVSIDCYSADSSFSESL